MATPSQDRQANYASSPIPRVRGLQVRAVRLPMEQPHQTASGTISESPLVLTDITTEDGMVGHSMIFTYTVAALKPTADLIMNLEQFVRGEALAPTEITDKLTKRFRLLGSQGLVGMAVAALDMALWDALARSHTTSLVRLVGGTEKPIPAYGAVGYDGVAGSARVAERWAKLGFKGVKAKIGYPTVEEDLQVIRAMRKAVGHETAIMVDYNQSLAPPEAVRRLRVLDEERLTWVEEPVLAHDYQGHALVAREIKTPIQCGENWWGPHDMRQAIETRASDYMMPDVMKIGGVTGWMRAAALGEAYGIPLSNHLWPEISTQLMCATPTAHFLEYADWWNPVLAEPLQIEKGMATVKGIIGTGVAWNERKVEKFLA
jgi:mandelate racemase